MSRDTAKLNPPSNPKLAPPSSSLAPEEPKELGKAQAADANQPQPPSKPKSPQDRKSESAAGKSRSKARSDDGCVAPSPHSEAAAAESAPAKAASSKPATKPAKEERLSTKPKQASKPGQGTNAEIAKKVSDLPTNVPVDGDAATYRDFLLKLNPLATTVNRAKIQLAWIYGEALNAFIASPHYKRGDYTKLLADIGMSWTKAHYVRMLAECYTLARALKHPSYSDLLREMKQLPDREPKRGQERGIGDRTLDAVDPPDDTRGDENEDTGEGQGKARGKKPPKGGRPRWWSLTKPSCCAWKRSKPKQSRSRR